MKHVDMKSHLQPMFYFCETVINKKKYIYFIHQELTGSRKWTQHFLFASMFTNVSLTVRPGRCIKRAHRDNFDFMLTLSNHTPKKKINSLIKNKLIHAIKHGAKGFKVHMALHNPEFTPCVKCRLLIICPRASN